MSHWGYRAVTCVQLGDVWRLRNAFQTSHRTHFKLISASPEELLENCPSPGGSAREHEAATPGRNENVACKQCLHDAAWEVSEFLPGAKLWLNARDLPNLLCQKLVQDVPWPMFSLNVYAALSMGQRACAHCWRPQLITALCCWKTCMWRFSSLGWL